MSKSNKKAVKGKPQSKQTCAGNKTDSVWPTVWATVVSSLVVGVVGLAVNVLMRHTEQAERCEKLEALIREKDNRIADQRMQIATLDQRLQMKDVLLSNNESVKEMYRIAYFGNRGVVLNEVDVTNTVEITKTVYLTNIVEVADHRSVAERLGITTNMTYRELIEKSWDKPVDVASAAGAFIPVRKEVGQLYCDMSDDYFSKDYTNAVCKAAKILSEIHPVLGPFINRGAKIDIRLSIVASMAYRIMGESAFARGDYQAAAYMMGMAAGVAGPTPPPELLALESIAGYKRSGGKVGFFTQHMKDAIDNSNDRENYRCKIFNELARYGYLQLHLPKKGGVEVGEAIDWPKMFGIKKLDVRPLNMVDGDYWSTRWVGFGRYEKFNYSEAFRNMMKATSGLVAK